MALKSTAGQSLGRWGEEIAARYLSEQGYTILSRNLRTPYGEIDLLARLDRLIVFVEVKTRRTPTLGPPEISVTPRKQAHILAAAQYYMQQNPEPENDWRIDVIAIQSIDKQAPPQIIHFQNAFS